MRALLAVPLLGAIVSATPVRAQNTPSDRAQTKLAFHDDEASVLRGLPNLERQTKGPYAGALAIVPPANKTPWYLWIGKGQVELEWSPAGWADNQQVFPFERAVAVVTQNVCGVPLRDDPKGGQVTRRGALGACRCLDQYLGAEWDTGLNRTIVLKPWLPGVQPSRLAPVPDADDDVDTADADLRQIRPHPVLAPSFAQLNPRATARPAASAQNGQSQVEKELVDFLKNEVQKIRKTGPSVGMGLLRIRKVVGGGGVSADGQIGSIGEGDLCGVMLVANPKNLEKCGAFATCTADTMLGDKGHLDMLHGGPANEGPPILGKCRPGPSDKQGQPTIVGFSGISKNESVGTNKRDYKCSVKLSVDLETGSANTVWDCGKALRLSFEMTKDSQ